jgi:hypothetical protein
MRVTIDTNLINVRGGEPSMGVIERWDAEGKLVLVGASRLLRETAPYTAAAFAKAKSMPNVGEPLVWDAGAAYDTDAYFDGPAEPSFAGLASVLFPRMRRDQLNQNQTHDVMHLLAHVGARCDVFLTNNTKDFIKDMRRERLAMRWRICVQTPAEFVEEMVTTRGW